MPIISNLQSVKADVCLSSGVLSIDFFEDPSYTRSETVIIDLMQRSIGIIFQNGYHHIGDLPASLGGLDCGPVLPAWAPEDLLEARLARAGE